MKLTSTVTTGFRSNGSSQPLVAVGENAYPAGSLTTQEMALVDALEEARLVTITERDPAPGAPRSDVQIRAADPGTPVVSERAAPARRHVIGAGGSRDKKQPKRRVARRA